MMVVIELSKAMTVLLEERAAELHVPTEQLAARLLNDALLKEAITPTSPEAERFPTLAEIIASIRALPSNSKNFHPPTKSVAQVLAELEANLPLEPDITPEEWDRLWAEFEQQQKALDRAEAIAEGRL